MKIALLVNDVSGTTGYSSYALNVARGARCRNDSVVFLCSQSEDAATTDNQTVHPVLIAPHRSAWNPVLLWHAARGVRSVLQKECPDIVHIVSESYVQLVPFLGSGSGKYILTVHGTYAVLPETVPRGVRQVVSRFLFTRALKMTDRIIAVSQATKAYVTSKTAVTPQKVEVIHNAIALPESMRKGVSENTNTRHIITVGAVKARKGIHETIPLLARWADARKQKVVYDVVGQAHEESEYVRRVRALADECSSEYFSVTFHGHTEEEEKAELLGHAALYVHLERVRSENSDREGFGIGIIEAAAYGVPALVAKGSATTEAVDDGVSGFIADLNDDDDVYAKIDAILLEGHIDPHDARAWAEAHSPEALYTQIRAVYERVMNQ